MKGMIYRHTFKPGRLLYYINRKQTIVQSYGGYYEKELQ